MEKGLHTQDLGTIQYNEAFDLQQELHCKRVNGTIPDTMLLLEHPHVFTLGRHATDTNILWNKKQLEERRIMLMHVDRGGDATYHGPGQIVGYPIIKLKERGLSPKKMVEWVENLIIRTVAHFGISSYVHPEHPGIWVGDSKLCAIGMRIRNDVSYHGFALNVSTDLSYFNGIVPCGIKNKNVCSLESLLGRKIDINEVKAIISGEAHSTP